MKTTEQGPRGYDAGKQTNGRNRDDLVEPDGLVLRLVVDPADIQDCDGAQLVLAGTHLCFPRLGTGWADGISRSVVAWAQEQAGVDLEIVSPPLGTNGFQVLPRRWVVERSIAWMGRCRRMSTDDEAMMQTRRG